MTERQTFQNLSADERAVVGDPEDYAWDSPVTAPPARGHPRSHFSMRIDPVLYGQVQQSAIARGITFSDAVREALEASVGQRRVTHCDLAFSVGGERVTVFTSAGTASIWVPTTRGEDVRQTVTSARPEVLTEA